MASPSSSEDVELEPEEALSSERESSPSSSLVEESREGLLVSCGFVSISDSEVLASGSSKEEDASDPLLWGGIVLAVTGAALEVWRFCKRPDEAISRNRRGC